MSYFWLSMLAAFVVTGGPFVLLDIVIDAIGRRGEPPEWLV
jgi:hypothetical protein